MANEFQFVKPQFIPPMDDAFRPAALANRLFEHEAANESEPLIFCLERQGGKLSRFETNVFPQNHPRAKADIIYAERIFKFLLWQRGGRIVYMAGPSHICEYLVKSYSPGGKREFDYHFMSEQVYEQPLIVKCCELSQVPPANDIGEELGRHLDGYRIGFDLGASDRKVSAMVDGRLIFSEEVVWEPRKHSDPEYHFNEILTALRAAACKMPRVDAIGGSAAGIYINNRPMVASLFRSVSPENYHLVRNLFQRISEEMNTPLQVINDGDVTALAGSMSLDHNGVLGISMGSSLAAGYVDMQGRIKGWLNELAFAPIDYSPNAPVDEWSGDIGCGAQYLSQQCVFRLAPRAGVQIADNIPDAAKLSLIQEKLESGNEQVVKIWQSIGIYLGYALAHYAKFYEMRHVLILGRVTSGSGGTLILDGARKVINGEFPDLSTQLEIQLPDERSRRIGQAIAAASLPIIKKGKEIVNRND